jgi:ribA/ribD-fused uncharacterized protein
MRVTDTHIYFYTNWMSNWTPNNLNISYDNYEFTNSEQLFMYLKAKFFKDEDKAKEIIVLGYNPKIAKQLGREVKNYNDLEWSKVRFDMMYIACLAKFKSSKDLTNKLLATDNKILVEASSIDPVWGILLSENDDKILDEKNWKGQNLLGKVLMKVREELK